MITIKEIILRENKIENAINKLNDLPKGQIFDDAKNITSIFKKSNYSWSYVIETFEKNISNSKHEKVFIKDIFITQPNIQIKKVIKMLNNIDSLPIINAVKFKNNTIAIYDGHHRLITYWALGMDSIMVNLVH